MTPTIALFSLLLHNCYFIILLLLWIVMLLSLFYSGLRWPLWVGYSTPKEVPTPVLRTTALTFRGVTVNGHRNMEASLPLVAGSCSFAGRIIHMERGQLKRSDFTSLLSILKVYMVCTVCQELLKVLFKYKPLSRLATRWGEYQCHIHPTDQKA